MFQMFNQYGFRMFNHEFGVSQSDILNFTAYILNQVHIMFKN